jgi:uncharacterized protein (TIGR02001 family)
MRTGLTAALVSVLIAISDSPPATVAEEETKEGVESEKEPPSESGFNATVTFATDYVFRGISQTDGNPAVQGNLGYDHRSGFYAGMWGSNVDDLISNGSVEIDLYGGYTRGFDNLGLDFAVLYYAYPGDDASRPRSDYLEVFAGLDYAFNKIPLKPTLGVAYYYSPDYFGESGRAHYVNGTFDLALPLHFGLGFELGYQTITGSELIEGFSYTHWRVSLTKQIAGFELELNYQDTSGVEEFGEITDARAVFLVSRSF